MQSSGHGCVARGYRATLPHQVFPELSSAQCDAKGEVNKSWKERLTAKRKSSILQSGL